MNKELNKEVRPEHYVIDPEKTPFYVTEAFRNLLANVGFAIPKKDDAKGKVICVSSSVPQEGKSTISVNLALTCAMAGYKTALVDCDMRKPSIRKLLGLHHKECVMAYLSGQCAFDDVIVKNYAENLDILPCSRPAPNPVVLLNNDAFGALIDRLAGEYDYVIIDTPPVSMVSDAVIIGQKTDGVLLVTRQKISDHRVLNKVINQLKFAGCHILGFVWNGFAVNSVKSYKYGYKYGYKENGKN